MPRRLGTSISKTALLVGCILSAISIYKKLMDDDENSSRRQDVERLRVIKQKRRQRLSRIVKQNWHQTVAQLTAQYNAGSGTSVSKHIGQRTLLDMGLRSRRPTRALLLTKCHRLLRLQWTREHQD